MVRPERGGAEKARSVTARRDEGDKMLQSHTGFCSQSIPTDIEIQLPLSIHLHFRSSVHLFLQCILLYLSLSTQSFTHTFAFSKKKKKCPSSSFSFPSSPPPVSIQSLVPSTISCHVLQSPWCLSPVMKLN